MYCELAKRLCKQKNIEYEFISIIKKSSNAPEGFEIIPEIEKELLKLFNKEELKGTTMPQIFVDGNHIGGSDRFREFLK